MSVRTDNPPTSVAAKPRWQRPAFILGTLAAVATIVGTIFAGLQFGFDVFQPRPPTFYSYSTQNPGPGCDKKGAQWVLAEGQADCLDDRLQMSTTDAEGIGQVFFYGTRHLPTNYRVSVDVDGLSERACAGIITRNANTRKGGYGYQACTDGTWLIVKYDLTDTPFILAKGQDTEDQGHAFNLAAISQGISMRFSVNGREVGLAVDGAFTDTDAISLFVTPVVDGGSSSANFQNFVFNELTS
jgi:hypothetical protein